MNILQICNKPPFPPIDGGAVAMHAVTKGLIDKGQVRIVGNNHLKMDIHSNVKSSETFPAIAFGQGQYFDDVLRQKTFSACYAIEETVFNGNVSLQLNVKDIRF